MNDAEHENLDLLITRKTFEMRGILGNLLGNLEFVRAYIKTHQESDQPGKLAPPLDQLAMTPQQILNMIDQMSELVSQLATIQGELRTAANGNKDNL